MAGKYKVQVKNSDGSLSDLPIVATDSDKLNGQEASYYLNYSNFTNKPTIPTVNNGTLTIQKNGTTVKTFTANSSSNVTANITVPTKASDIGAVTESEVTTLISGKQDKLTTSTELGKINGKSFKFGGSVTIESTSVDLSNYYTKEETNSVASSMASSEVERVESEVKDYVDDEVDKLSSKKDNPNLSYYATDNGSTTAGTWVAKCDDVTALFDGLSVKYKIAVAGASTTTFNLNGLGAKTVYLRGTTKLTTHYAVDTMVTLIYNASKGAWYKADYDSNSDSKLYQYYTLTTSNAEYPIIHSYTTDTGTSSYKSTYGAVKSGFTFNPSTNTLSVGAIKENGTLLSSKYATKSELNGKMPSSPYSIQLDGYLQVYDNDDEYVDYYGGTDNFDGDDVDAYYYSKGIYVEDMDAGDGYCLDFPAKSGTIALLDDVVRYSISMSNYNITLTGSDGSTSVVTDISYPWTRQKQVTTNAEYPILLSSSTTSTTTDPVAIAYRSRTNLYANPSNGRLSATTFNTLSDRRLKENIKEFAPKKSILELPIVEFDFKDSGLHQIGCLAQDLQEICPEIVDENSLGYLGINESKIVYLLLHEVKKLKAEIEALKRDGIV